MEAMETHKHKASSPMRFNKKKVESMVSRVYQASWEKTFLWVKPKEGTY